MAFEPLVQVSRDTASFLANADNLDGLRNLGDAVNDDRQPAAGRRNLARCRAKLHQIKRGNEVGWLAVGNLCLTTYFLQLFG